MHRELLPRLSASLSKDLPEFIIASSDQLQRSLPFHFKQYSTPEELGVILRESKLGLFPLLHGRGNRIHLLEAMASGLPLVCTGKAIDGLTLRPSFDLYIEDDADGLTSLILRFLRDPQLCEETGNHARETIEHEYGEDSSKNSLKRAISEIFLTHLNKSS